MKFIKLLLVLTFIFVFSNITVYTETNKISATTQLDKPVGKVLYKIGNYEVTTVVPPENFDPMKATDEELRYYGLPQRPTDPELYKHWVESVGNNKKYVEPVLKSIPISEVFGNSSLGYGYKGSTYK